MLCHLSSFIATPRLPYLLYQRCIAQIVIPGLGELAGAWCSNHRFEPYNHGYTRLLGDFSRSCRGARRQSPVMLACYAFRRAAAVRHE